MSDTKRERIKWIDIAKGVAILLVVIGHTADTGRDGELLRGIIFSFHMPLFFILSMATYRTSKDLSEFAKRTKKAFRHLMVPALVIFALRLIVKAYYEPAVASSLSYWKEILYRFLLFSGTDTEIMGITVHAMGMMWFFCALFLGRSLYDYLSLLFSKEKMPVICAALSLIGILIGRGMPLIFSLDVVLAILPFFYIGNHWFDMNVKIRRFLIMLGLSLAVWAVTLYVTFPDPSVRTYMELAIRRYPLYPLCFICAVCGTLVISCLSKAVEKIPLIGSAVAFLGKNSMIIFLVHCMDYIPPLKAIWYVEGHQFISAAYRGGVVLAVSLVIILVKQGISVIKGKAGNQKGG